MPIPKIAPYPMPRAGELPDSVVAWRIDPARAVLLVHDVQRYFLSAFDPAADPFRSLVGNIGRLLTAARGCGVPVVYTVQPAAQTPAQRGLLGEVWGAGIPDGEQAGIPKALAPRPQEEIVTRTRYNAFLGSSLDEVLARYGRDQIVLVGVYAHIGCQLTAAHAFMTERQAFPVADAQADFSRAHHEGAIAWLAGRAGRVVDTAAVLEAFAGTAS